MGAAKDTVVNIGCYSFIRLLLLVHVGLGLDIAVPHKQAKNVASYVVSDVANYIASLPQHRTGAEELLVNAAELARKQATLKAAPTTEEQQLLEEAFEIQEESRMEVENARGVAAGVAATLRQFMGQDHGVGSCRELVCGGNGYCSVSQQHGASCQCKAGYQGNGYVCNPAASFVERPLISAAPGTAAPQVADLHVASLRDNSVAVVFRDSSRQNRGFIVLGEAVDSGMRWSAPALLSSSSQVFGPVVVELDSPGGLAVAYRSEDRGGTGILLGARRDERNRIRFGTPKTFAHNQAQGMVLLAMPESRVVILFADHIPLKGAAETSFENANPDDQFEHYGTSLLAQMPSQSLSGHIGLPKLLGKYHFAKGAVSRITAAPITPTTFAIAYRQGRGMDVENAAPSREASVSLAEVWGTELVFTTKPLSLEPGQEQIWARSVAGLGGGAFAYTYHSGAEQATKQAVLRLDPETHRLVTLQKPTSVSSGFTPFVSTISTLRREGTAAKSHGHRLFTFLGGDSGAKGQGKVCAVGSTLLPERCQEVGSTAKEVLSVASTLLSDNRVFLLTTTAKGEPYYALIGL